MKSALPGVLRLIGAFLAGGGFLLGMLDAYGAARAVVSPDQPMAGRLPMIAEAVAVMLGLGGLAALLYAAAALLEMEPEGGGSGPVGEGQEDLKRLLQQVGEMRAVVERLPDVLASQSDARADLSMAKSETGTPIETPHGAEIVQSLRHVTAMLREIRELALLNDAQRQQRLVGTQKQRREQHVAEIQRMVQLERWAGADKALAAFQNEFPNDPEIRALQTGIADGRGRAEQKSIGELQTRVEDLIAIASWERAYAEATVFVENFPHNAQGKQLLARVIRERDVALESTANKLYAEIKSDIERRYWRRALANAKKLLERSPGHRRSAAIREQLQTIKENAEIEERQEQERQIQELMRAKRFPEAIELAEDVLERFPHSPQAESLEQLLPKMRELAIEKEIESES